MSDQPTSNVATRAQFARLNGWGRSYVTELAQAGRLVLADNGKVLVRESLERIKATADPAHAAVAQRHAAERAAKANGDDEQPKTDRVGSTFSQAKAVRERYNAMLAKVEYEQRIGELVSAKEVRRAAEEFGAALRRRWENLADSLAAVCAAESDPARVHALISDEVEQTLLDLSKELRNTQLGAD